MEKYIYDDNNGLWYELQGDYYIPCLTIPKEENLPIGIWGQRHRQYLKEHRKAAYTTMMVEGKLNRYLADVDKQAEEMYHRLIKEMAERQGVIEQLKATDQMTCIRKMNNIQAYAREVVNNEVIFV